MAEEGISRQDRPRDEAFGSPAKDDRLVLSMPSRNGFFRHLTQELEQRLPAELGPFRARPMFNIFKVSFGNERVHYEVGLDVQRRLMEVALHFEDGPVSTSAYLNWFDRRIVELKETLGWEAELERWTLSWGRLFELHTLNALDQATTQLAADRLLLYITTLQPLVAEANVAPERSADPVKSRRSRWS